MDIAALICWVITALGGFVLLGKWISAGGAKAGSTSRLPAPVVFGHFVLAAAGLVLWIIYLFAGTTALAWISFIDLLVIALLGFTMVARWLPVFQGKVGADGSVAPAEKHFPVAVVGAHGLFAVATVVTVLLSSVGVGN